jgi:hypothetical protein
MLTLLVLCWIGDNKMTARKQINEFFIREEEVNRSGWWSKVKSFFESGDPKHPEWNRINKFHDRLLYNCDEMYGDTEINIDLGTVKFDYYKENPNKVLCVLKATLKACELILKFIKTSSSQKICERNYNLQKCIDHVEELKISLPESMNQIKDGIRQLEGGKLSETEFKRIMGRIRG